MSGLKLQRLGMIMQPEPGNPHEVGGVLNPGAARGPDGELYLFPRMVAKGNYSRIGIARVRFNDTGDPAGVERLGIALEPDADYERRPDGSGGCEARGLPWRCRKISSTGHVWGSLRLPRQTALISATETTKMPASSRP